MTIHLNMDVLSQMYALGVKLLIAYTEYLRLWFFMLPLKQLNLNVLDLYVLNEWYPYWAFGY